ncbi:MAG: ABC transporter ATP-binding protein [Actinomycetota bacterium]|nr:ABC transporter ATP-binding protein [Actinomycetota bacterium]
MTTVHPDASGQAEAATTPTRIAEPGEVRLRFDGVSKTFPDGTHALADISFDVRAGEFVTVVGPSGCGKSTILKLATGLIPKSSGTIELPDENVGYVFQDATLLPWRTVARNVELFCELHDVPKADRARLAAEAIELVGLSGFEKHHPKRLSGGMKMRVSLARSLTLNPGLFLFDEPFGALDEITRERLNDEVLRLFLHECFGGLFITHSINEAIFLSTRVLVMSARPGRMIAEFDVPFAYPRRPELRFEPEFAELGGQVSEALRGGHT